MRLFSQRMLYCEGEVHCAQYIIIDFGLSCYIASVACRINLKKTYDAGIEEKDTPGSTFRLKAILTTTVILSRMTMTTMGETKSLMVMVASSECKMSTLCSYQRQTLLMQWYK